MSDVSETAERSPDFILGGGPDRPKTGPSVLSRAAVIFLKQREASVRYVTSLENADGGFRATAAEGKSELKNMTPAVRAIHYLGGGALASLWQPDNPQRVAQVLAWAVNARRAGQIDAEPIFDAARKLVSLPDG